MEYQRLGQAGVKVSRLSLGSWVTFSKQVDLNLAAECMSVAFDYGVNFFDNAEVYANGKSEQIMGEVIRKLNWPRMKYMTSTKFFWGITDGPNEKNTLNRKYLMHAIQGSLKRFNTDYFDLVYCHRPDSETPMTEIVWAMHDMIDRGYALYWGTSEWTGDQILSAYAVAEKYNLRAPVVEQPEYNLLRREKVEVDFLPVFEKYQMGLTTWSPLASGVLTGKYLNGNMPSGSRLDLKNMSWLKDEALNQRSISRVEKFVKVANELSTDPAALAIAWCLKNKNVSSVITGATSIDQIHKNMKALDVVPKLTPEIMTILNQI
jgi:voltage-dependent potassium channel beta subunit